MDKEIRLTVSPRKVNIRQAMIPIMPDDDKTLTEFLPAFGEQLLLLPCLDFD